MNRKVYGPVTSKLLEAWKGKNGDSLILAENNVQALFNEINLFPSRNQVFEMVRCARESTLITEKVNATEFLTFGEFCIFATELKRQYANHMQTSKSCHIHSGTLTKSSRRPNHTQNLKSPAYEVFLGGSCNPTTWRHDIVIPFLKSNEITYYNPQQSDWVPEMIELEHQAKQTSQVLFFVLNEMTRNVVAMMEVAYMSGRKRDLIVMLKPYPALGHQINGEVLSFTELNDLENAMATVHDLVERQGSPVFNNIESAMSCVAKVIKQKVAIEDLGLKDNVQPVKLAHIQIGDILVRLRETFDSLDTTKSGRISLKEMTMAFRIHTRRELPQREMQQIIDFLRDGSKAANDDLHVTFEDFCKIVSEKQDLVLQTSQRTKIFDYFSNKIWRCLSHPFSSRHRNLAMQENQVLQRPGNRDNSLTRTLRDRRGSSVRDVYLGGSMDGTNTWRNDKAIPELKKNALTFFNPQTSSEAMALCSRRLLPIEAASMDNARVLLFVILGNSLSVKAMCEAAYYIGLGRKVVMCLERMPETLIIEGKPLSKEAWKDFERGRRYLSDMANREAVPIFDNIPEAISCVVQKCRGGSTV